LDKVAIIKQEAVQIQRAWGGAEQHPGGQKLEDSFDEYTEWPALRSSEP